MGVRVSKIDIDLLDIENKRFTEKQLNSFYKNLNSLNKEKYYVDNMEDLKKRLKNSYYSKSSSMLEYFVKNNLLTVNTQTKKIRNFACVNGIFKYANDFHYDMKSNDINEVELKFKEHKKGEFLSNSDRLYGYKKISKVMYLDYVNNDKKKVFITFTLPNKQFHKYNKYGTETKTFNSNDKFEKNVEKGLKLLNEIHRYFYHTLKYKVKRYCKCKNIIDKEVINIDFIKILEPHKSLDGHLHSLFYIDNRFINLIEEVYNMTIEHFKLIETKFEILQKAKASTYLNKYLLKTTKSENLFYNQYKRYFSKTRFFTSSNFKHTNQEKIEFVYKYLSKTKPRYIKLLKKGKIPIYYKLEQLILKGFFIFEEEKTKRVSIDFKAIEKEFEKVKNKKDIEQFKRDILKNIDTYTKTYYSKTIKAVKYKKNEIYNKQNYKTIPIYGHTFEKLKINPFLHEEIEEKLFDFATFWKYKLFTYKSYYLF